MKPNAGAPTENVVITNGTVESQAAAIKLGTESPEVVRNIQVTNCVIRNCTMGTAVPERPDFGTSCPAVSDRDVVLLQGDVDGHHRRGELALVAVGAIAAVPAGFVQRRVGACQEAVGSVLAAYGGDPTA